MKTAFLKHYGKIFFTILLLGAGSYFHVDTGKAIEAIGKVFVEAPVPAVVSAPTAPEAAAVDAGK